MNSKLLLKGFGPFVSLFFLGSSLCGQNGNQELITEIERGNLAGVQRCIAAHPGCVNTQNDRGETPLHVAAQCASRAIVRCLIQNGADINRNTYGTPLHRAIMFSLDNFEYLVDQGADVHIVAKRIGTVVNLLALEANRKSPSQIARIMRILMRADADFSSDENYALLMNHLVRAETGMRNEYQEAIKLLVQYGVPLSRYDRNELGRKYPAFTQWIQQKADRVRAWLSQTAGQSLPKDVEQELLSFILSPAEPSRAEREEEALLQKWFRGMNKKQRTQ